jgi:hypothetical protein
MSKVDKNPFSGLPVEGTKLDKLDEILERMVKSEEKQSSDHNQVMDKISMLDQINLKVGVLEESFKRVLSLEKDVTSLKMTVENLCASVEFLKQENNRMKKKIESLEAKSDGQDIGIDDRHQHSRNECARFNGVHISKELEDAVGHNQAAMITIDQMLRPLLDANKSQLKMNITDHNYLKNAHCLPIPAGAAPGTYKCPPIIARFHSRPLKDFILRNKHKLTVRPTDSELGVTKYRISADLTKDRYKIMQELIKSKHFYKVWHIDGRVIKYVKREGDPVCKVKFFEKTVAQLLEV